MAKTLIAADGSEKRFLNQIFRIANASDTATSISHQIIAVVGKPRHCLIAARIRLFPNVASIRCRHLVSAGLYSSTQYRCSTPRNKMRFPMMAGDDQIMSSNLFVPTDSSTGPAFNTEV